MANGQMKPIIKEIEKKLEAPGLIDKLSQLSNSELNSFNLELFRKQSERLNSSELLKNYSQNRFLIPSKISSIPYKEYELKWLRKAENKGIKPIQLSPLAPLGCCSVLSCVHQNNIVSAGRITEVISDATNVLALQIAKEFKVDKSKRIINYCTVHRHVRAQYFQNPELSAHFGVFCMVSGGYDMGSFLFELEQVKVHLLFYMRLLLKEFPNSFILRLYFKIYRANFKSKLLNHLGRISKRLSIIEDETDGTKDYYNTMRIKIFIMSNDKEIDLVDMGFVDWTQKLLNNKKHRLFISGSGLERIFKMKSEMRS